MVFWLCVFIHIIVAKVMASFWYCKVVIEKRMQFSADINCLIILVLEIEKIF